MQDNITMETTASIGLGIKSLDIEKLEALSVDENEGIIRLFFKDKTEEINLDAVGIKFYEIFNTYIQTKNGDVVKRIKTQYKNN